MNATHGEDSVLVIGVGNEFRSDDGLGIYVVRALGRQICDNVRIVEASGEGTALMALWSGESQVILVDAVSSIEIPGTLHRVDAIREQVPRNVFASSSHQFGVAEAVEMARELHTLPVSLILFGIEAESYDPGVGLSQSVVRSVPDLLHLIEYEIQQIVLHAVA